MPSWIKIKRNGMAAKQTLKHKKKKQKERERGTEGKRKKGRRGR